MIKLFLKLNSMRNYDQSYHKTTIYLYSMPSDLYNVRHLFIHKTIGVFENIFRHCFKSLKQHSSKNKPCPKWAFISQNTLNIIRLRNMKLIMYVVIQNIVFFINNCTFHTKT